MEGFGAGSKNKTINQAEIAVVLKRFLSIAEHIMSWEFQPLHGRKLQVDSCFSNSSPTFKPPLGWKDTVLDKELLSLFFSVSFHS